MFKMFAVDFGLVASPARIRFSGILGGFGEQFEKLQHEVAIDGGFTFATHDVGPTALLRLSDTVLY